MILVLIETFLLLIFRRQLEDAISNYVGEDPLSVWYEYICWIEQSYPKSGTESGLDEVVLKCIMEFEDNNKYKQDRRMVKLFIKYVSVLSPDELKIQSSNFHSFRSTHKRIRTSYTTIYMTEELERLLLISTSLGAITSTL